MTRWQQRQCRYCGRDMFEHVGSTEPTCCSKAINLKVRQDKFDANEHKLIEKETGMPRGKRLER